MSSVNQDALPTDVPHLPQHFHCLWLSPIPVYLLRFQKEIYCCSLWAHIQKHPNYKEKCAQTHIAPIYVEQPRLYRGALFTAAWKSVQLSFAESEQFRPQMAFGILSAMGPEERHSSPGGVHTGDGRSYQDEPYSHVSSPGSEATAALPALLMLALFSAAKL